MVYGHGRLILTSGSANAGFDIFDDNDIYDKRDNGIMDASDFIVDIREYDVPYHVRVAIDKGMLSNGQPKIFKADEVRHPDRKMVYSRREARSCHINMP